MNWLISKVKYLLACQANPISVLILYFFYKIFYKCDILIGSYTRVNGIEKITGQGTIKLGLMQTGFNLKEDRTLLSISDKGSLYVAKYLSIGKGCRFDISGQLSVAEAFFNSGTKVIASNKVIIGKNCAFSWDCTILDNDFHQFNTTTSAGEIHIGDNVWVGCNSMILKNTKIANGCVIAANSLVRGEFNEQNCLIAGNPAKIVKRNITWEK